MKIALLTTNQRFKSEIETVNLFFDYGLDYLHLKKRRFSRSKTKKYIKEINEAHRRKIFLHKYHWLAVWYKLKGIHLGRSDRQKPIRTKLKIFFMKLFHPKLEVSVSFHSLQSATQDKGQYHHAMLSPVFDSISKKNYSPAFSERQLVGLMEKTNHRYFALGGVDETHIQTAKDVGFEGVVVYGSIWNSGDEKLKTFKKIFDKVKSRQKDIPEVKINPVKIKI